MVMFHVWRKLKLIKVNSLKTFFISLIGLGLVFMAKSIPGYCVSFTGYENNTFSYVLMQDSDAGIGSDTVDYCDIDFSGITLSFLMANLESGSSYISTQGWYKLIVDTTEGSYVMRSGNLSLSSSVSSIQTKTYTLGSGSYSLPGAFVSIRIEGSYFITMLNGSSSYYYQFSSAVINGWSKVDVQGSGSDYSVILSQIYNELVDQGLTLDDFYNELLDQGISLDTLVKSMCFDFPDSLDGNYNISSCYFVRSSDYFNNNPLPIGKAAFDIKSNFPSTRFYLRVPSSRKVLFYVGLQGGEVNFGAFYDSNGDVISRSLVDISEQWSYRYIYYTFPDSVPVGSVFYFVPSFTFYSNDSIRFAFYDYVIGANDILDFMKSQWSSTQPGTDSLDDNISDTGDMQDDVNLIEDTAFTDFTGAYDHTGIAGFSWTVFSGMSIFSSIVNKFYFALPSEFSLYITAVLIVGVIAVLISAVGRIIKKGGD